MEHNILANNLALTTTDNYIIRFDGDHYTSLPFVVSYSSTNNDTALHIPAGTVVTKPIVLLYTTTDQASNSIRLDAGATAEIIAIYANTSNQQCSIALAENSNLNYCILQQATTTNLVAVEIYQQASSTLKMFTTASGGETNRLDVTIKLLGDDANCTFNALECPKGNETHEIQLNIEHISPNCCSETTVRGTVTDNAHSIFTGKIAVLPNASQTKANLQHKHLLLSPYAKADSRPQLEIDNDDVQCTHGASIGQLDPEAIFYMRSRGIPIATAKQLLIAGFIEPIIAAIPKQLQPYAHNLAQLYSGD